MQKGSMNSTKASGHNGTSGRFTALAFAATLAMGFSFAMATDAQEGKPAAQGVVAEKAIQADGGGDCAKAKEDCPKGSKAECCKKGAKGHHHKHDAKGAKANTAPGASGSTDKPAATPAQDDKSASHPG